MEVLCYDPSAQMTATVMDSQMGGGGCETLALFFSRSLGSLWSSVLLMSSWFLFCFSLFLWEGNTIGRDCIGDGRNVALETV